MLLQGMLGRNGRLINEQLLLAARGMIPGAVLAARAGFRKRVEAAQALGMEEGWDEPVALPAVFLVLQGAELPRATQPNCCWSLGEREDGRCFAFWWSKWVPVGTFLWGSGTIEPHLQPCQRGPNL